VATVPASQSGDPVFDGGSVADCLVGEKSRGFLPFQANYSSFKMASNVSF
jgi:hypothetical protein